MLQTPPIVLQHDLRRIEAMCFGCCYRGQSLNCLVGGPTTDGPYYEAMPPAPAMRLDDQQGCNQQDPADSVSSAELELVAKLEEANRLIESDAKSLNSLSGNSASGHSRKSSDTSQISLTSGTPCHLRNLQTRTIPDIFTLKTYITNTGVDYESYLATKTLRATLILVNIESGRILVNPLTCLRVEHTLQTPV